MSRLLTVAFVGSGILAASGLHAETVTRNLAVRQGGSLVLDAIYALRDDCSPGPFPQISVKQMPANGSFRAGAARYPIATDKNCPNVTAKSLAISYFPYPNFVGEEVIVAKVVMPTGKENEYRWVVKVSPLVESAVRDMPGTGPGRSTP